MKMNSCAVRVDVLTFPQMREGSLVFDTYNFIKNKYVEGAVSIPISMHWDNIVGKPTTNGTFTGDYNHLINKPNLSIYAKNVDLQLLEGRLSSFETQIEDIELILPNKADKSITDNLSTRLGLAEQRIQSKVSQSVFDTHTTNSSVNHELLKTRVSQLESVIPQITQSIVLKADKIEFNSLKDRVATTETTLTTQAGQIASLITQVGSSDVNDRLTIIESSITQQAGLIATKVSQNVFDTSINGISTRLSSAETTIQQTAHDITLKADAEYLEDELTRIDSTFSVQAGLISTKVSKQVYDDYVLSVDGSIISLGNRLTTAETEINQTYDAISLKADKTVVDSLNNRISTAESSLTLQANQIATKVSQTEYNTGIGGVQTRLTTAESSIVQNANQIATKVSQTEYNTNRLGVDTRLSSAESSIIQNANQIASKVSQTEYDTDMGGVETRLTTAESGITQNANEIATKVSQTQYNSGIAGVETRLTSAESSITQNANQISTKVSKTEYDTDMNGVETRLTTAESSITQNATEIDLRVKETDLTGANLVSRINLAPSTIKIQAKNIDLQGSVTISALEDKVDNKSTNHLSQPSTYRAGDTWTLFANTTIGGVVYKKGSILTTNTSRTNNFVSSDWSEVRYTDDTKVDELDDRVAGVEAELVDSYEAPMSFRYIRDWASGSSSNTGNFWVEIQAINTNNENIALGKSVSITAGTVYSAPYDNPTVVTNGNTESTDSQTLGVTGGNTHITIDLGQTYDIEKIKVWHFYADARTFYGTKTEVSEDGVNWTTVFDSTVSGTYVETAEGRTTTTTITTPTTKFGLIKARLDEQEGRLNEWASDGFISPQEKTGLKQTRIEVEKIKDDLVARATSAGVSNQTISEFEAVYWYNFDSDMATMVADTPENIPVPATFEDNRSLFYNKANELEKEIQDFVTYKVDAIEAELLDFFSDDKLTPNEKNEWKREMTAIQAEVTKMFTVADSFGITTEKNALQLAYTNLSLLLTPLLTEENMGVTSDIDGATLTNYYTAYNNALTDLRNKVTQIVDQKIADNEVYMQWSPDATTWHEPPQIPTDKYVRIKKGAGNWGNALRLVGQDGVIGKSAYQIAVDNGFVGTEAQWLASLEGADGQGIAIKGSVVNYNNLPTTGLTAGDAYLVQANGLLYIYDGTSFPPVESGVQFKGDKGADGTNAFVHFAYSTSYDGSQNFSTTSFAGATYLGVATSSSSSDPSSYTAYEWSLIKGADAPLLYLATSSQVMTFDSSSNPSPSYQSITIEAKLQNTSGIATFTATPYIGTTAQTQITLGGGGNIRTLASTQWAANIDRVVVTATVNGLTDTTTIVKLKAGADGATGLPGANGSTGATGAPGQNAIVGYLTNEAITLPASTTGVVSSFASATGSFKVYEGITDKTSSATFSKVSETGCTASINSSGNYSISAMSVDNATVLLQAVYNGVTIQKTVTLSKSKAGSDGRSITSIQEQYYLSDSVTALTGGSWSNTPQTWAPGKYFWTKSVITYSTGAPSETSAKPVTGNTGEAGSSGADGSDGRSITNVDVEYYLSTSSTLLTGGTWQTTSPTKTPGTYIWSRTKVEYSDSIVEYTNPALISGDKGDRGDAIVSATPPVNPYVNLTWIDISDPENPILKYWNGTQWKLVIDAGDLQAQLNELNTDVGEAKQTAEDAAGAVTTLNNYVNGAFKDNLISEAEAVAIEKYKNTIQENKQKINVEYNDVYSNPLLTGTPKINLQLSKNEVDIKISALLASITTAISDGKTTVAEKQDVDAKYNLYITAHNGYITALEAAKKAITAIINEKAEAANLALQGSPLNIRYIKVQFNNGAVFHGIELKALTSNGTNIALNKAVSVYGNLTGEFGSSTNPATFTDGNDVITDITNLLFIRPTATHPNSHVIIDLGQVYTNLDKLVFFGWNGLGAYDMLFAVSEDGGDWTTVKNGACYNIGVQTGEHIPIPVPVSVKLDDLQTQINNTPVNGTGSAAERPVSPPLNSIYFNTTIGKFQQYTASGWIDRTDSDLIATDYLKTVFQKGTINLAGGAVLSNVLGARDITGQNVRSYMSGLLSNPVAFAAGVNNFGLANETRNISLNHDGSGHLANGRISWNSPLGNTPVVLTLQDFLAISGKIGKFTIDGGKLKNTDAEASILIEPSIDQYIRINKGSSHPLISVGTSSNGQDSMFLQSYAAGATVLRILANSPTTPALYAIASAGGHQFYQRQGERWNAPGLLAAIEIKFSSSGVPYIGEIWTITALTVSSVSRASSGNKELTIFHDLGHTDYVVHPGNAWNAGSVYFVSKTSTSFTIDTTEDNVGVNSRVYVQIIGRNKQQPETYYNTTQTAYVYREGCNWDEQPSQHSATTPANDPDCTSNISQSDANNLAWQKAFQLATQDAATNGYCTPIN